MSRFTVIDPSVLPNFTVIEPIDVEAIITARMAAVKARWAAHNPPLAAQYDVEGLEFDSIKIVQEANADLEMLVRDRVNQAARATTLYFASGSNLDAIASRYPGGVPRVASEIYAEADSPLDKKAKDDRYRRRIWLSPNGLSPHGVAESYVYWALTAVPELRDATAVDSRAGADREPTIILTCMTNDPAEPRPTLDQLLAVRAYVHSESRKGATDVVNVVAPGVTDVEVRADVWLYPNAVEPAVRSAILAALAELIENNRWLGEDLTVNELHGALAKAGVHSATLLSPAADVRVGPGGVVRVTKIEVAIRGRRE